MWSFPLIIEANQRLHMFRILLQKSRLFKLKKIGFFSVFFSFFLFKSLQNLSRHKLGEINCKEFIQARTFLRIYIRNKIQFIEFQWIYLKKKSAIFIHSQILAVFLFEWVHFQKNIFQFWWSKNLPCRDLQPKKFVSNFNLLSTIYWLSKFLIFQIFSSAIYFYKDKIQNLIRFRHYQVAKIRVLEKSSSKLSACGECLVVSN